MAKFTFATTEKEGFDNHILHSIRGYEHLWDDVLKFSKYFVEDDTNVVDIGCSTGKLIDAMYKQNCHIAENAHYVGIEIESDFYDQMVFTGPISKHIEIVKGDVRGYEFDNCNLVTSIFTLQFMPHHARQNVIDKIYDGLNVGGAFIFSEKIFSDDPQIQDMMTFCYYDFKNQFFTEKSILDKERNLRYMMKPCKHSELITMCETAGFTSVQPFWQNFNFVGMIAIKRDI